MFSRRKGKDGKSKKKGANPDLDQQPAKPRWTDAWARTSVEPEEIHELVKRCTEEIKSRGTPPISHLEKQSIPHAVRSPEPPLVLGCASTCSRLWSSYLECHEN